MSMRTELKKLSNEEMQAHRAELFEQMQEKMIEEGVAFSRRECLYDHSARDPEEIRAERDKMHEEYGILEVFLRTRGQPVTFPMFDIGYVKKEIARRLTEKREGRK